jgi:hypothetical protein
VLDDVLAQHVVRGRDGGCPCAGGPHPLQPQPGSLPRLVDAGLSTVPRAARGPSISHPPTLRSRARTCAVTAGPVDDRALWRTQSRATCGRRTAPCRFARRTYRRHAAAQPVRPPFDRRRVARPAHQRPPAYQTPPRTRNRPTSRRTTGMRPPSRFARRLIGAGSLGRPTNDHPPIKRPHEPETGRRAHVPTDRTCRQTDRQTDRREPADGQRGATTTESMPGPTWAPTTAPTSLT